jgi:general secretion pathway protein G
VRLSASAVCGTAVRPGRRQSPGFTLIEVVLVMSIFGMLLALAAPSYTRMIDNARIARAIGDIRTIEKDIASYEADKGEPPPTLASIGRAGLMDPWDRPYEYLRFAGGGFGDARKDRFLVPLNSTYDLYSRGKDGDTKAPLNAGASLDDIVRANDGGFVGLAVNY